jgi:uncharacterized FlaG/YvyC family protein
MDYVRDKIEEKNLRNKITRKDMVENTKGKLDRVKDILNTEIYFEIPDDSEDSKVSDCYEFRMVDLLKSYDNGDLKCYVNGKQNRPVSPISFFENLSTYMKDYKYWELERSYDYLDLNSELNEKIKEVEELETLIQKMNEVSDTIQRKRL